MQLRGALVAWCGEVSLIHTSRYVYHEPSGDEYRAEVNRGRQIIARWLSQQAGQPPLSAPPPVVLATMKQRVPLYYYSWPLGDQGGGYIPFCEAPCDRLFCE